MNEDWHKDQDFWIGFYPFIFSGKHETEAKGEVEKLLRLSGMQNAFGSVLDMPCGTGRHSIHLAKKGWLTTCVDINPLLLRMTEKRFEEENETGEFIERDMRQFSRPDSFELAICLYTSLGYFEQRTEDIKTAGNICCSLRPGGIAVFEMQGLELLQRDFESRVITPHRNEGWFIQEREMLRNGRLRNRWTLKRGQSNKSYQFDQTIYSGDDLHTLLRESGFNQITLYGDFEGSPYDHHAQRLIAVAKKE